MIIYKDQDTVESYIDNFSFPKGEDFIVGRLVKDYKKIIDNIPNKLTSGNDKYDNEEYTMSCIQVAYMYDLLVKMTVLTNTSISELCELRKKNKKLREALEIMAGEINE